ncbi:CRISPR-associated protein Cas5 [Thermodesulfatator indicus DSM 15286]|uniref:CRISPR-associated protein Cas5 n=1 Tax=Thermodesulfatator indicus (strain DSM 15286 / JCM 11887 / CIR29812) TaxID=667014 RepID=F8A9G9_THEID|nr:CRISPR-associated protein Cas5 [Thermodesulfatator indicus]AEH44113.1 CRISPR-associated protein Cas5 [Thermodesulfatator indicus DSM 15286]
MEGLAVTVSAPVASFRRPLDINFQRTLLLPPPTTCLGIAGAALGLSEGELWRRGSPLSDLKVSVLLEPSPVTGGDPAVTRDLLKVLKIKNKKISAERSPYFRELLFFSRYTLLFAGKDELLDRLRKAFADPAYPLSLGREDELARIEAIEEAVFSPGEPLLFGTMVPGDLRELEVKVKLAPGLRVEPPSVEVLPAGFEVVKGVRHPVGRKPFTIIPLKCRLEFPKLETLSFRGRNFVWLNS